MTEEEQKLAEVVDKAFTDADYGVRDVLVEKLGLKYNVVVNAQKGEKFKKMVEFVKKGSLNS